MSLHNEISTQSDVVPFKQHAAISSVEAFLFWSRWLQAPLYVGLVVCQFVYVYKFGYELYHLITHATTITETEVMLSVLGMIDLVMIANLLYMVIVGGYETFVSKIIAAENHPDRPDWLGHIDVNLMKIKFAISLITISSIHLLKTFINAPIILLAEHGLAVIISQVSIHLMFLLSAIAIAVIDRMLVDKK